MNRFICDICKNNMTLNENDGTLSCTCGNSLSVTDYKSPELGSTGNTYYNQSYAKNNINESNGSYDSFDMNDSFDSKNKRYFIPFKLNKQDAIIQIKRGIFSVKPSDKVNMLYVPVWTADIDSAVSVSGIGTSYTADNEISYYDLDTEGILSCTDIMTPATNDISPHTVSMLMPFDIALGDAVSDNADETIKCLDANIIFSPDYYKKRCCKLAKKKASFRLDTFDSTHNVTCDAKSALKDLRLIYLPVFNAGDIYINGQSGKVAGKLPVSKVKVALFSIITFPILFVIISLVLYLIGVTL